MAFDGAGADEKFLADFGVGEAFGGVLEDDAFAFGEVVVWIVGLAGGTEGGGEGGFSDARSQEMFAFGNGVDGADEFFGGAVFENVTGGAGAEGFGDVGFVRVHGADNDMRGRGAADAADDFKAVHAGHGEVEQKDVGLQLFGNLNGFEAIGGFADEIESGFVREQRFEPLANQMMVFGYDYSDL